MTSNRGGIDDKKTAPLPERDEARFRAEATDGLGFLR
jgi:hypothetical protein